MNKTETIFFYEQNRKGAGDRLHLFTSVVVSQLHFKAQASNLSPHAEKSTPLRYALLQEMSIFGHCCTTKTICLPPSALFILR